MSLHSIKSIYFIDSRCESFKNVSILSKSIPIHNRPQKVRCVQFYFNLNVVYIIHLVVILFYSSVDPFWSSQQSDFTYRLGFTSSLLFSPLRPLLYVSSPFFHIFSESDVYSRFLSNRPDNSSEVRSQRTVTSGHRGSLFGPNYKVLHESVTDPLRLPLVPEYVYGCT